MLCSANVIALQIVLINIHMKVVQNGRLTDFQKGQIVCVRLAGASLPKMATSWDVSRVAVSKAMTAYTNRRKTSSTKRNSDWNPKINARDCHTLKKIVSKNHRTTAAKVTAELSIYLEDPVSTNTVQWELYKSSIHCRAAIAKPLIPANNAKRRKRWCDDCKTWTSDDWKYIVWSDESSFTLFPTAGRVYVWRIPKETYNPECLVPTVKHGGDDLGITVLVFFWS